MTIIAESCVIKQAKCIKCGWTAHKVYPASRRVVCQSCLDERELRRQEAPAAEVITHGGPERV